uniref:Uncharacterized protein n=1 Tax=Lepeophtheirus salmonis TaxID=72036 RepID=A0A0K2V932_LEPSM
MMTPLIFIPKGVKINQRLYLDTLQSQILSWIHEQQWQESYCFQQDKTPSHTAKSLQEWCQPTFKYFWSKGM